MSTTDVLSAWRSFGLADASAAPPAARLRALVQYAVLAPSSHNSQPWLFRVVDDALELRADRTRALPVVDPFDRELTISCGAALHHLRVALRHFGAVGSVVLLPDPDDRDLLATVRLGAPHAPTPEDDALFHALPRRHTNRRPFDGRPLPPDLVAALREAARREGAELRLVEGARERDLVADLVAQGDRHQGADPAFRRELAAWVHPNRSRSGDGMPGEALGMGDLASVVGPWVLRTFDWGHGQAARDRQLAAGSPTLVVLWTAGDEPGDWLRTGQALSRVLLRATADDACASFLNQPVEQPPLRDALARALRLDGAPQLVLRMGFGRHATPTPRRPAAEVLLDD